MLVVNEWMNITVPIGDAFTRVFGANDQYGSVGLGLLILIVFVLVLVRFGLPFEVGVGALILVSWMLVYAGLLPSWLGIVPVLITGVVMAMIVIRLAKK